MPGRVMAEIAVVGLGQSSLDLIGRLESYPAVDEKAELDQFLIQGGGPVATALVTLARLGVGTALVGRCGDDEHGRRMRRELEQEGVDCRWLDAERGASSQLAFIAVDGGARRTIFWHRGSARPLHAAELSPQLLAGVRVLHLDGLQAEASLAAAHRARAAEVTTVLDGGTWRAGTRELLPYIDHLVVSERFARQVTAGGPVEAALEPLLEYGARAVTVTRGARGSITRTQRGGEFHQPAFAVTAVDTTGCGDVFHGGYIYGLLQEWPLPQTVRFAAACAALKCRALGGRTAIPRRDEVEELLQAQPAI
ncbi:carbohydrate kinase, PfkB family [Desulfuromonas sp. DDH964]|nr:carbohydrate kinase, PfkB family [Desulfuromonas sp. DDH964]